MPIITEWYDEAEAILFFQMVDLWTLDEVYQAIDATAEYIYTTRRNLHMIVDMRNMTGRPLNLLSTARYAETKLKRNSGAIIIVGGAGYMRALVSAAKHFAPKLVKSVTFVDSLDDAKEQLEIVVEGVYVA